MTRRIRQHTPVDDWTIQVAEENYEEHRPPPLTIDPDDVVCGNCLYYKHETMRCLHSRVNRRIVLADRDPCGYFHRSGLKRCDYCRHWVAEPSQGDPDVRYCDRRSTQANPVYKRYDSGRDCVYFDFDEVDD